MQIHVRDNPRAGRRPHVAATTAGGDAGTIPYRTVPEHTIPVCHVSPEPGMRECLENGVSPIEYRLPA